MMEPLFHSVDAPRWASTEFASTGGPSQAQESLAAGGLAAIPKPAHGSLDDIMDPPHFGDPGGQNPGSSAGGLPDHYCDNNINNDDSPKQSLHGFFVLPIIAALSSCASS